MAYADVQRAQGLGLSLVVEGEPAGSGLHALLRGDERLRRGVRLTKTDDEILDSVRRYCKRVVNSHHAVRSRARPGAAG